MSDEKEKINLEDIEELAEKESAKTNNILLAGITFGLLLVIFVYDMFSVYHYYTDDSIAGVQCPRDFYQSKAIKMKTLSEMDKTSLNNHLLSFAIDYTTALYPRVPEDFEPMTQYIVNHSSGMLKKRYQARLNDSDKIKTFMRSNYTKFWHKGQDYIKIRKKQYSDTQWVMEIPGYLHKKQYLKKNKSQPTITLYVSAGKITRDNPLGLYVTDKKITQLKDPISGEENVER